MNDVRKKTIQRLHKLGVPYNENLPLLSSQLKIRSDSEIAKGVIICYGLTGLAFEADPVQVLEWLEENGIDGELGGYIEKFKKESFTEQEIVDLSWFNERIYMLCEIGRIIDFKLHFDSPVDLSKVFPHIPPEVEIDYFVASFKSIQTKSIIEELDFYYCLHSAYRHPELWPGSKQPDDFSLSIIRERRSALEWVLHPNLDWLDISLDT